MMFSLVGCGPTVFSVRGVVSDTENNKEPGFENITKLLYGHN